MDSTRSRAHEQHSHPGTRQDAAERAASPLWSASSLAELDLPYQPAQPAGSARQRSPILPPLPGTQPLVNEPAEPEVEATTTIPLPYEAPTTVPVLSIRPTMREAETILDDPSAPWLADQSAAATINQGTPHYGIIYDDGYSHDHDDDDDDDGDDDLALDIPDTISRPLFARGDAFTLGERRWGVWRQLRKTALLILPITLMVAVGIAGAAMAAALSRQATPKLPVTPARPTVSHANSGIVIQPATDAGTPTPTAPTYQIGAWLSDNAPSGGTVKIFVRVSESVAPVANVPVMLTVQLPGATQNYGPVLTDGYGLATFTVVYGGVSGLPVFVTATATLSPVGTPVAGTPVAGTPIVETPTAGGPATGTPTPDLTTELVFVPI